MDPESKPNDSTLNSTASSTSFTFPSVPLALRVPQGWCRVVQGVAEHAVGWVCITAESPKFRVPESFTISTSNSVQLLPWRETLCWLYNSKQTCLLLDGNTVSPKAVHYINPLIYSTPYKDRVEQTKAVKASALRSPDVSNLRDSRRIVSNRLSQLFISIVATLILQHKPVLSFKNSL